MCVCHAGMCCVDGWALLRGSARQRQPFGCTTPPPSPHTCSLWVHHAPPIPPHLLPLPLHPPRGGQRGGRRCGRVQAPAEVGRARTRMGGRCRRAHGHLAACAAPCSASSPLFMHGAPARPCPPAHAPLAHTACTVTAAPTFARPPPSTLTSAPARAPAAPPPAPHPLLLALPARAGWAAARAAAPAPQPHLSRQATGEGPAAPPPPRPPAGPSRAVSRGQLARALAAPPSAPLCRAPTHRQGGAV